MTKEKPLFKKSWASMDKKERYQYSTSFEVISRMRTRSWTLTEACRHYNIPRETVLKAIRPVFKKEKGRWKANKTDNLVRPPMHIIDTRARKLQTITIRGSRTAHAIGRYWRSIDLAVNQGDARELQKFKGVTIKDVNDNTYTFETDTEAIIEVLEKTKEPDYPEPYRYG